MKITSSVNLEKDIWDEINNYQQELGLSSRNVALERMLLERRMLLVMKDIPKQNIIVQESKTKLQVESNSKLDNSLKDSFNNMPD